MPTPDASQYTRFRRYASIAGDALTSGGSKISPFNTSYSIPMISASSQALFLPSANKETKFTPPPVPSIDGPFWVSQLGNGSNEVTVFGITTDPNDGTLIVCGETNQVLFGGTVGNTFANKKAFVARYTKSGIFIEGGTLGSGLNDVTARAVTTDVHGNIYICGETRENLDSGNGYGTPKGFCVKFSSSFELVWVLEQGSGLFSTYTTALVVSPDGYLYIGGNTRDTDWSDAEPHVPYNFEVAYILVADPALGVILNGGNYGSGSDGATYITALSYIPSLGGIGPPSPLIAIAGYSYTDLEFGEGFDVSNPGGAGSYGFVAFTYPDLSSLASFGIGSGDNQTAFSSMSLVTSPDIGILFLGGQTNEYLDGPDKDSLLAGGGNQGFITGIAFAGPGGFIGVTYFGDEQNFTAVTAISSNNRKIVIGGYTNENLDTGMIYDGMVLTNFTLELGFNDLVFSQLRQIGTGTSFQVLEDMASDTFGNFYVGGYSGERLPNGPSIPGTIGYIAKVSDQPKTYNTPIFFTQDTSYNSGNGYCVLEYTAPLTIDWGDGTVQNITTGSSDTFNHTYSVTGTYNIVVDAKSGGEITLFRANEVGVLKLDVSRCPTLLQLRCDDNLITNLNVSGCPDLQYLRCDSNPLVSLDVSGLASLTNLITGSNSISTLHLEGCGLTDSTTTTLENPILLLSNDNDNPGRVYLYANQQTTYFEGNADEYFSAQLPAWTFIILPDPPG
uniref:PKD domain-containing protein n=1 Tax=viral metagenome TaxID=1070528 RepID=A0A6C0F2U6_9ZZZZ